MDAQNAQNAQKGSSALTSLVVTAEMQQSFDGALAGIVGEGAIAAAIVERSGMTLAAAGSGMAGNPAVGALVGGVFKSLKTLSGLLGETAIRSLKQQGPQSVTLMLLLDSDDLLVATFPRDGAADRCEAFARDAGARISALLSQARQAPPATSAGLLDASAVDDLFGTF